MQDIHDVYVEGFGSTDCKDSLTKSEYKESNEKVSIESEVDRIYVNAKDEIALNLKIQNQTLKIKKNGFPDIVLWNPWIEKSKTMSDMGIDQVQLEFDIFFNLYSIKK